MSSSRRCNCLSQTHRESTRERRLVRDLRRFREGVTWPQSNGRGQGPEEPQPLGLSAPHALQERPAAALGDPLEETRQRATVAFLGKQEVSLASSPGRATGGLGQEATRPSGLPYDLRGTAAQVAAGNSLATSRPALDLVYEVLAVRAQHSLKPRASCADDTKSALCVVRADRERAAELGDQRAAGREGRVIQRSGCSVPSLFRKLESTLGISTDCHTWHRSNNGSRVGLLDSRARTASLSRRPRVPGEARPLRGHGRGRLRSEAASPRGSNLLGACPRGRARVRATEQRDGKRGISPIPGGAAHEVHTAGVNTESCMAWMSCRSSRHVGPLREGYFSLVAARGDLSEMCDSAALSVEGLHA
jgi:hypothetical protein